MAVPNTKNTFNTTTTPLDISDLIEYLQEGSDENKLAETRAELTKLGVDLETLEL